jgi:hypothetical protein
MSGARKWIAIAVALGLGIAGSSADGQGLLGSLRKMRRDGQVRQAGGERVEPLPAAVDPGLGQDYIVIDERESPLGPVGGFVLPGESSVLPPLPAGHHAGHAPSHAMHGVDLAVIAKMVDGLEEQILDDGTVVIKRPDVWGQARMTKYRVAFEENMKGELGNFAAVLSARVARTDQTSFESTTALGASLTNFGGQRRRGTSVQVSTDQQEQESAQALEILEKQIAERDKMLTQALAMLAQAPATTVTPTNPFAALPSAGPFNNMADNISGGKLGLEPNVYLNQKAEYLNHANGIRRENMGDDTADTAGYGLNVFNLPVSIRPGDKTRQGHGATLDITVRPDYPPDFLPQTFRSLVIADLVDELTPIVYEILVRELDEDPNVVADSTQLRNSLIITGAIPEATASQFQRQVEKGSRSLGSTLAAAMPTSRAISKPYPISPSDMPSVFFPAHLVWLAEAARNAMVTEEPRATDVRAFLSQQLSQAYDLLPYYVASIEETTAAVSEHRYSDLLQIYVRMRSSLPGTLKLSDGIKDPTAILSWCIAVDAGLLNRRLREEMVRVRGLRGFEPGCEVESLFFYLPEPDPLSRAAFEGYVSARWPIVTFALDPTSDEQNIADALSLRRDMQLALAYAFATGQVSFSQMNRFRRRIELDSETIALNRTVTAYAHGNESFGWRFSPRYQNPPQERSNLAAFTNLVTRGGPGRDYGIKNSRLEDGQRDLTVVMVLPTFLPRVKFQVAGNWYPLHDPDELIVPTNRMVNQGRKVMELRSLLSQYCDPSMYRPGELERVVTKIDRVESMLPLQTEVVPLPYENMQSGFDLFTPGIASLAPKLVGYEGVPALADSQDVIGVLIFGKNISIQETKVIAGGQFVPDDNVEILSREVVRLKLSKEFLKTKRRDLEGKTYVEVHLATPNGISNRVLIPYAVEEKAAASAEPKSNFQWEETPKLVAYYRTTEGGMVDVTGFEHSSRDQIVLHQNGTPFPTTAKVDGMAHQLAYTLTGATKASTLNTEFTTPEATFSSRNRADIKFTEHLGEPIKKALAELFESEVTSPFPVSVTTYIRVTGEPAPIRLDNKLEITLIRRDGPAQAGPAPSVAPTVGAAPVIISPSPERVPRIGPAPADGTAPAISVPPDYSVPSPVEPAPVEIPPTGR